MTVAAVEVERAYRLCERATRQAAANFYYGICLLPRSKRHAMSAVYAFARRVDDIGDEVGIGQEDRLARLAAQRELVASLAAGTIESVDDPVAVALSHATVLYDLPTDALALLLDGVEHDVTGRRYETIDELVLYCRAVAGSIGRLCLAIFSGEGPVDPESDGLADDLGVAMQLTNILRDVREDATLGRVYLPAADLRRFGCEPLGQASPAAAMALVRFEADRAEAWFDRGLRLVERLDARSASCVLAMTGIYRDILRRISDDPAAVLERRIALSTWEKAWVAGRCLAVTEATELARLARRRSASEAGTRIGGGR
jgi:phytoene synthase